MAKLRRLLLPKNTSVVISTPAISLSRRGITSKLFVGAKIVTDRVSDRSKGFGFVTYASEDEAEKALQEMNGKPLNGRVVFVDYAKAKTDSGGMPIARGPPEPPIEQRVLLLENCVIKQTVAARVASLALAND